MFDASNSLPVSAKRPRPGAALLRSLREGCRGQPGIGLKENGGKMWKGSVLNFKDMFNVWGFPKSRRSGSKSRCSGFVPTFQLQIKNCFNKKEWEISSARNWNYVLREIVSPTNTQTKHSLSNPLAVSLQNVWILEGGHHSFLFGKFPVVLDVDLDIDDILWYFWWICPPYWVPNGTNTPIQSQGATCKFYFVSSLNTGFQLYLSDPVHLKMASAPEGIAAWT